MSSMSKGQVKQVFTFILFIVVVGFIVLLGYRAISGMLTGQCTAERARFLTSLQGYIEEYDDYGSVHTERLDMPCAYRRLCLANRSASFASGSFGDVTDSNKQRVVEEAARARLNILLDGQFMEPWASSDKLVLEKQVRCFNVSGGSVSLQFEGRGTETFVTER